MKSERTIAERSWLLVTVWTLLVLGSAAAFMVSEADSFKGQAMIAAEVAFEKDIVFRLWNSRAGGVYVRPTEKYPPNPYLDIPDRDIRTQSGEMLTMINPAYMTRQAHELLRERHGVRGHITSLDPLRPGNRPDEWERSALEAFEAGETEVASVETMEDGQRYLRFMRPLEVEASCLKCHARQGYQVGDVRGGISVSVPLADMYRDLRHHAAALLGGHLLIWMAGSVVLVVGGRRMRRHIRQLEEAGEAAKAASRSKSAFLANMSHEIRTPLNGVVGMMQLLGTTDLNETQQEYVDGALQASTRLNRLLSDILDLSRVEAGRMSVVNRPFRLRVVFEELEVLFRHVVQETGVALDLYCDDLIPEWIEGDGQRLGQILFNLVGNALKFTEEGSVTVRADLLPQDRAARGRILFTVADTGIGMSEEVLGRVFEPFTQAEGTYRRQFQGAGLGLSIVLRLSRLLDGELNVQSVEGAGTTFFLSLPFDLLDPERTRAAAAQAADDPGEPASEEESVFAGRTALVVEDDRTSRVVLERSLERLGMHTGSAENGTEALRRLRERPYDVIFMDAQMPVMDGLEATRIIRTAPEFADRADVPIVAMTAYVQNRDRQRMFDAGMNEFLSKPLDMDQLSRVLAKVLRNV